MTQLIAPSPDPARRAAEALDALRWHAGWAAAVALETIAIYFGAHAPIVLILALLIGSLPALAALILNARELPGARIILLVIWTVAGALAACLAGGVTGPLGAWCLLPLAAASVLGGARTLALGAALSVLALALIALAQLLGLADATFTNAVTFSLGLFGLTSALVALAIGLLMERRRLMRRIEAELATKDALSAIMESQANLILWLDEAGRVRASFGEPPTDVSVERLKTGGLPGLCGPAHQADLQLSLTEAAERRRGALTFPLAGAEGVWLSLEVRALGGSGLVGVLRDITVEREHERDLERAKVDAESLNVSKSRFLANMSHELRTPLNAIMGFSDIMRARLFGTLPGKYAEYAELIHDAGSHLLDLINDVLDMSKIEAHRYELRIEHLDAREPISAALRLMRLQADDVGVKLCGVLPSAPLEIEADRRAIKQIGLNLISNALKFTPRDGLVTVSLNAIAGAMELSVVDTGVGIARADLDRLGQPYEQAGDLGQQARGTGLGLSLVRAFAELHGGEMAIESQLGEGTAVTVRLPVLVEAADGAATALTLTGLEPASGCAEPAEADHDPEAGRGGGAKVIPFKPQR